MRVLAFYCPANTFLLVWALWIHPIFWVLLCFLCVFSVLEALKLILICKNIVSFQFVLHVVASLARRRQIGLFFGLSVGGRPSIALSGTGVAPLLHDLYSPWCLSCRGVALRLPLSLIDLCALCEQDDPGFDHGETIHVQLVGFCSWSLACGVIHFASSCCIGLHVLGTLLGWPSPGHVLGMVWVRGCWSD